MPSLIALLANTVDLATVIILATFGTLFAIFTLRAGAGGQFQRHAIGAFRRVVALTSQATESAGTIHVALGRGKVEGMTLATAQSSLYLLRYLGKNVAHSQTPISATAAHSTLVPAALGVLRSAEHADGPPPPPTGSHIDYCGPHPLAFAVGADQTIADERPLANVMIGDIGAEGLLLTEAHRDVAHIGGSDDPVAAALLYVACDDAIVGEDVFASGAYLDRPAHAGSLAAQDALRVIIMITILVGVIASSMGLWG